MKKMTLTIRVEGRNHDHVGRMLESVMQLHPDPVEMKAGKDYTISDGIFTALIRIDEDSDRPKRRAKP
jgi:hypothetical protein